MNCKQCVNCNETWPTDDMATDAFGDSSTQMCNCCLNEIRDNNDIFLLVKVPDIYGTTFIYKGQLEELKSYVGSDNVQVIS